MTRLSGVLFVSSALLGALVRTQRANDLSGCYELSTPSSDGDVIFRSSPDSIRLDQRPAPSDPKWLKVQSIGRRPRSPVSRAFVRDVRWQTSTPDSVIIYAPVGMWMEHLRFAVDASGQARGRLFVYTDVVTWNDTAQLGIPLIGKRILCP